MKEFKFYPVISDKKNDPKKIIFNAPRPLMGHNEWQGDFRHGIFYVEVELGKDGAEFMVDYNQRMDAWIIYHLTLDDAKKIIAYKYPKYADRIEKLPEKMIVEQLYRAMEDLTIEQVHWIAKNIKKR